MRVSHFATKVGLALLLGTGCSQQAGDTDTGYQRIQTCKNAIECTDSNTDDPHQPRQGILNNFQMYPPINWRGYTYKVTGFYPGEKPGEWRVRGYHISPADYNDHVQSDGTVAVEVDHIQHGIYKIQAPPDVETMSVTACKDPATCGAGDTFENKELSKIKLVLDIPSPPVIGGPDVRFYWTFADNTQPPAEPQDRYSKDVMGIVVNWETKGIPKTPLCMGPLGEEQLMVPQAHTLWHPRNFSRSQDARSVTIACEKGAIAYCRLWGYWEGYEFKRIDGNQVDKGAIQQSCINMKLANYCGSGPSQTFYGTDFVFSDPIDPVLHNSRTNSPEAIWSESGAVCDAGQGSHRHKEIPTSCALAPCAAADWLATPQRDFVSYLP